MEDHLWTPWRMPYLKDDSNRSDDCIFCAKARTADDRAEHVLVRGKLCFVTLNLYPYNNGHLMIVPYEHTGDLEELPGDTLAELMRLSQQAVLVLRAAYNPDGFNVGINLGTAAGAGITGHLHQHIVPRWAGDTNYMTVVGQTRVIPEWIDDTYQRLRAIWRERFPD